MRLLREVTHVGHPETPQCLWKQPLIGPWLANRFFPDLNGKWIVTIQSNWPIAAHLKTAAANEEISFNPLTDQRPELLATTFDVKIKQTWFRTDVTFLRNEKTQLLSSETISVEFLQSENGNKSVAWLCEQTNKQDNTQPLSVTDQPKFFGSAVLNVNEDGAELQGKYWQNRSWSLGSNAARLIVLSKKIR
jgi:SMODS-associating 2TM, beta-strand rich effector domain